MKATASGSKQGISNRNQLPRRRRNEGGYSLVPFTGFSMYPFLRPGDELVVRKVPFAKLQVGHIVVYSPNRLCPDPSLTAHRIVAKTHEGHLVVKGDNLTQSDPRGAFMDEVMGQVVFVLRRGRVIALNRGMQGRFQRTIALLSRLNCTPGVLVRRLKWLLGRP